MTAGSHEIANAQNDDDACEPTHPHKDKVLTVFPQPSFVPESVEDMYALIQLPHRTSNGCSVTQDQTKGKSWRL